MTVERIDVWEREVVVRVVVRVTLRMAVRVTMRVGVRIRRNSGPQTLFRYTGCCFHERVF